MTKATRWCEKFPDYHALHLCQEHLAGAGVACPVGILGSLIASHLRGESLVLKQQRLTGKEQEAIDTKKKTAGGGGENNGEQSRRWRTREALIPCMGDGQVAEVYASVSVGWRE